MSQPAIVWFRHDLRLTDNPALTAAARTDQPLIFLYILDQDTPGGWKLGGASLWWLHYSLQSLQSSLESKGAQLVLRKGKAESVLKQLVEQTEASSVFWNRCYEPYAIKRDTQIKSTLRKQDIQVRSFNSHLLIEPWELTTKAGDPYRVFTPFWKACLKVLQPSDPLPVPAISASNQELSSDNLSDWKLLPSHPDWAEGLRETWTPGEIGAQDRVENFLNNSLTNYADRRDFPGDSKTSLLSPHLHWGELSPRQLWHSVQEWRNQHTNNASLQHSADKFLAELGWREFSYHLLYHFPTLPEAAFNERFSSFPWDTNKDHLHAWQHGCTGYPIVDAGMRQLWKTGWMHNRVRMVTASFLTKDLFIHWKEGEHWFWDTLVDADLASNSASWQWVAGSGADAAPYFRVFNPILQGERFDPEGSYIRRWVPELAELPDKYIHHPWNASESILRAAGVELGSTYPHPIVDHKKQRNEALKRFEELPSS